jgi:Uncharacterized conserved protein
MTKPTTKKEFQVAANESYEKLMKLIENIEDQEGFVFNFDESAGKEAHWKRDKNLRDVLVHLSAWHLLLGNWVTDNVDGKERSFLPEPYNWKNYGEMNMEIWEDCQSTPYSKAKDSFLISHSMVMLVSETLSEEELFAKGHFPWCKTTNVASYFISATSSHYEWAMKKIRKQMKSK